MSYSVAVAGASGYAGGELLRLLSAHPDFNVVTVTAHSNAGQQLIGVQPHLRSLGELELTETTPENLTGHDVVFLALPHGTSGPIAAALPANCVVIDCGADHRLSDPAAWERFYGGEFYGAWAYGIPELVVGAGKQRAALVGANRIAAPGCNASAVALSLVPGIAAGVIAGQDLVSVLSVGPSGAGKSLTLPNLASEVLGSANSYAVGGIHRHIPEIQQALRRAGAEEPTISFTPVIVPTSRGILAVSTAKIIPGTSANNVRAAWESAYADEPFVSVLPAGTMPRSGDTIGSNSAVIGLAIDEAVGRVVVVAALDNLTKGTAGAAIQCANIALGIHETSGLSKDGVAP